MKELEDVYPLPGLLTAGEVDCLYRLGQINHCDGVIVEIGSFKGKSTIALALGASAVHGAKVYAIDPHMPLPEEGYDEFTEAEFYRNISKWQVSDRIVPMIATSEEAAKSWQMPIRVLWIDGDHRYPAVRFDFTVWEPYVVEGGIIAMHDTIRKKGPKRVLWENVFCSDRFQDIAIIDNITAFRKVKKACWSARLRTGATLALRAVYITARKSRVPYSKPAGRWLLRKLTAQAWLPLWLFIFSNSIAR